MDVSHFSRTFYMPITLNYPTITIDNHFSVLAWRDQIEIDEFKLEETKE